MVFENFLLELWIGSFLGKILISLVSLAFYIYVAFAWMTIANKLKYKKSWLAWIPIVNLAMILQLGGFYWQWIFLLVSAPILALILFEITILSGGIYLPLFLAPILALIAFVIMITISQWRIFEKRNYPGWIIILSFIPWIGSVIYLIEVGFVAWKDRKKKKRK
mgnify:CR=1 FL=1